VTDPSSEPTSYSWNLSASVKLNAYFMDYNGVDISSPSDVDTGQSTASGTSHTALGVTTTTANDMLLTFYATATCVTWTPPSGMTQIVDFTYCANAASSNVDMSIDQLQLGSAGATGDETATDDSAAVGVTKTIALKPAATCHVAETLTKITPIALRAATTNTASGTSVVMNTPTSQQNDVMFAFLSFTSGITPTAPAGWTQNSSAAASGYLLYSYRHVAGASEPSTYTWTFSATASIAGWIGSYSGVDTTTPTDVNNSSSSSTATTFTTPTVTTTIPDDMIVTAFIIANNSTWTAPTRMTAEGNPIAGAAPSLAVFDGIQPVTASISRTATASTSGSGVSTILGLRPSIAATTIGSTSFSFANPTSTTLETTTFSTSAVTFATGERLEFDVTAGSDCNGSLSYDGTSAPSQLTVATIVVGEAVAGLLLLAPALPLAWRQRRR
jgi:hypothetical protein